MKHIVLGYKPYVGTEWHIVSHWLADRPHAVCGATLDAGSLKRVDSLRQALRTGMAICTQCQSAFRGEAD